MADSQDDKLYKAEYAKSGRASCKKCKENIAKDSLRMAIMVQVMNYVLFWPNIAIKHQYFGVNAFVFCRYAFERVVLS